MKKSNYLPQLNNASQSFSYALMEPQQDPPTLAYLSGQPITRQPSGHTEANIGWMNMPRDISNCPPGLEYLTTIDQLLVHQKVEMVEELTGFETKNKFTIKNSIGQKVYYAVEDSDCLARNWYGPIRPFDMKILDEYQNMVMHLSRPLACNSCSFPCCLQSMEISAPPGQLVGRVQQEWSILRPSFTIRNPADEVILRIEGSICICSEAEFNVMSADGQHRVGKIQKQWSGLLKELFTDANDFGITFPMDLDVKMKAVMLGACFLIDMMFFEAMKDQGINNLSCLI